MTHPTFAVAALAALLTACAASPTERLYTLTPAESAPVAATATTAITVGPVTLPGVADRPQIVTQVDENRVAIHEYHRWASPLRGEIARVVAANLAQALGTPRVWSFSQAMLPDADYQVLLDVQRFESVPGEAVTVDVLWTIRPARGGTAKTGRSTVRQATAGEGFDALAAAHSRALARVSQDIAAAMRAQ